jgi:hypothetical protein
MSKALIEKYVTTVNEFLTLAKSFPGSDLSKSPADGGWSGAFVVHHIADSEAFFSTRFLFALTENRPNIATFDEEVSVKQLGYANRNTSKSISAIEGSSNLISDVLASVAEGEWNRISIHPETGEMTITMIMEKVLSHYQAHIGQLREIKAAL